MALRLYRRKTEKDDDSVQALPRPAGDRIPPPAWTGTAAPRTPATNSGREVAAWSRPLDEGMAATRPQAATKAAKPKAKRAKTARKAARKPAAKKAAKKAPRKAAKSAKPKAKRAKSAKSAKPTRKAAKKAGKRKR